MAPDYRNVRTLISFGDAPLDSGVPIVSIAREIANARVDERGLQWAVVDPRLSTSASKSDLWVPIIPGGISNLRWDNAVNWGPVPAIQIPTELLKKQASALTVAQFADHCGIPPTTINRLADMLVQGGKQSAAIPGRGILSGENGVEDGAAILALNTMVGSVPAQGSYRRKRPVSG